MARDGVLGLPTQAAEAAANSPERKLLRPPAASPDADGSGRTILAL